MMDRVMMWEMAQIRRRDLLESSGAVERRTGLRVAPRPPRATLMRKSATDETVTTARPLEREQEGRAGTDVVCVR
jgi:hypothetical protein